MEVNYSKIIEVSFFKLSGKWYTNEDVLVEFRAFDKKEDPDQYNFRFMEALRESLKSHRLNNEMYAVANKGVPFPLMVPPKEIRKWVKNR